MAASPAAEPHNNVAIFSSDEMFADSEPEPYFVAQSSVPFVRSLLRYERSLSDRTTGV